MADALLTFRPVGPAEGETLAALRVEAMRPSLERVGRFDPDRARARFLSAFSPEYTREILEDGVRAGFFVLRPQGDGLLLDHLYVRPSHQNRGIGAAVLRTVFADADARGLVVRAGALKESDSNRFYVRHGFVLERQAEFDNYYIRRPGNAIWHGNRRVRLAVPRPYRHSEGLFMTSRQPLQLPAPLYVRVLAILGSCVLSGLGLLALVSGHVEERWTRYGHTDTLDGTRAQSFGLSIFFFGLLPLMLAVRSPTVAKWIGCLAVALGLASVFLAPMFLR